MNRGGLWWADLGVPRGSGPGLRRPVLVVSSDDFNASRLGTVVVAVITSNVRLAAMPGNVLLPPEASGLDRASVVNVTQLMTIDRRELEDPIGDLPAWTLAQVDAGLAGVLGLAVRG